MQSKLSGIRAALLSATFLGLAPIFGKQAILLGLSPLIVVAMRTGLAAVLLFIAIALTRRRYLYIYPAGFLGCLLAGSVNGVGSLFYYGALGRIDAGIGQLIYALYPLFVAFWMVLDRQPPSRLTILRMILAIVAIYFLTHSAGQSLDLVGVLMMVIASALYALHLPINQRVLYEMPAPTVTLYTLTAMSLVVVPAYLIFGIPYTIPSVSEFMPVLALTIVTFLSRLTLFLGVKKIGGMQTALLGLSELLITILLANIWLGERMDGLQWVGALLLVASLLLIGLEKQTPPHQRAQGWLRWISHPRFQYESRWLTKK